MNECPCGTKRFRGICTYSTQNRPRDVSHTCLDCRFSWGVKDD